MQRFLDTLLRSPLGLGMGMGLGLGRHVGDLPDPANWLLATGAWADSGEWVDAETWDDGA